MTKTRCRIVTDRSDDTVDLTVAESLRDRYVAGNIQPTSLISISMFAVVEAEEIVDSSYWYGRGWWTKAFMPAWEQSRYA